uniref:Fibrinogen C-terminal domain-containing protein n=1 Tax=Anguilla anguilla TaxID=7936 RepID=A0A0E9PF58_ANGAN
MAHEKNFNSHYINMFCTMTIGGGKWNIIELKYTIL